MTNPEIQFCERTCRTAASMGIGIRRYKVRGMARGFEWRLPSGEIVRAGAHIYSFTEQAALHTACRTLSEKLASL